MMNTGTWFRGALLLVAVMVSPLALAADHLDSPTLFATGADPSADITDVYSWVDGNKVILVLDVFPLAATGAQFSNSLQYVLHTESTSAFGVPGTRKDVICTFDTTQKISCWIGADDYVTGDASSVSGLASASGKVTVFAGLRSDPFFFNLTGFKDAVSYLESLSPAPTTDGSGCPSLSATQATTASGKLAATMGGPPTDFFGGKNVLSIVLSVDKRLLVGPGPLLNVWASTNKAGG
jgi:hypothetical protein